MKYQVIVIDTRSMKKVSLTSWPLTLQEANKLRTKFESGYTKRKDRIVLVEEWRKP
jgi:hypothetical protein